MKLKIELELDSKTISGRVLEQDEELRNYESKPITLIQNDEFEIASLSYPALGRNELFVRGNIPIGDNDTFCENFETIGEAEDIYKTIIELVNGLNGKIGGVVDEWGRALFLNSDYNLVSIFLIRGGA